MDTSIPFVDAKVAAAMCKGRPIVYAVDPMAGVTDDWILSYVLPTIVKAGVPEDVCKLFGRAALFHIFGISGEQAVPPVLHSRITQAYQDVWWCKGLEEGTNPMQRKPIAVTGYDTEH